METKSPEEAKASDPVAPLASVGTNDPTDPTGLTALMGNRKRGTPVTVTHAHSLIVDSFLCMPNDKMFIYSTAERNPDDHSDKEYNVDSFWSYCDLETGEVINKGEMKDEDECRWGLAGVESLVYYSPFQSKFCGLNVVTGEPEEGWGQTFPSVAATELRPKDVE